MPSSFTPVLRLTLPADGELVGTWGQAVNNGVTALVEAAIAGTAAVTMTDADYTLAIANGAADEARQMFVRLTGTLTTSRSVICPTASKLYFVRNATTGGQSITFKTAAGSGIVVPNGAIMTVYCDGTNVVDSVTRLNADTTGNAGTATQLLTPRTLTIGATGKTFNGSADVSWSLAEIGAAPATGGSYLPLTGGTLSGNLSITRSGAATLLSVRGGAGTNQGAGYFFTLPDSGTTMGAFGDMSTQLGGTPGVSAGIYTSAGVPMVLAMGGVDRGRFDATGQLGLNRTPSYTLDVGGTMRSLIGAGGTLLLGDSQNTVALRSIPGAGDSSIGFYTQALAGNVERMRIDSSGNVGIGVSTGLAELGGGYANLITGSSAGGIVQVQNTAKTYAGGLSADSNGTRIGNRYGSAPLILTSGTNVEAMRIDASGRVGVGVTPAAWIAGGLALQVGPVAIDSRGGQNGEFGTNVYMDAGATWRYIGTGAATQYVQDVGAHRWLYAASGAANAAVSWSEAMRIDASGNVGIGTATPTLTAAGRGNVSLNGATDAAYVLQNAGATAGYLYAAASRLELDAAGSRFFQINTNGVERLRIDASGNVGINTLAAAGIKLHVSGSVRAGTSGAAVQLQDPSGTTSVMSAWLNFLDNTATERAWLGYGTANNEFGITNTLGVIVLRASGAEQMRVAGGAVLAGTTGIWSGNASRLNINYTGVGAQFGIAINTPDATATQSRPIMFLAGGDASGGGSPVVRGYIGQNSIGVQFNSQGALELQTGQVTRLTIDNAGNATFSGTITGNGSGLTALNATQLTSGTVPDARFPATLPAGSGVNLTALNASNLGSGTVPAARIGSGTDYAIGDGSTVGGLAIGYRNIPRGGNTTIDTTKRGRVVVLTAGATIPNATFAADDTIALYNNSASAITITQGASLTMYGPNAATGNRTLAARGWATIWFNSASECKITGEVT